MFLNDTGMHVYSNKTHIIDYSIYLNYICELPYTALVYFDEVMKYFD